ncbi:MAG: hypothetical protein JSW52_07720 [Candidatus Coatesbacteria bacterium]|nr:MAG: hypothetical protein JSW52_07720 [Candidatus Coatesbacteria bacterium]
MVDYEDRLPQKLAESFKADPARWLLKARSPLVRYRTYTDLLGYPPDHPKPAALLPRLDEDPDLRAVLDSQTPDGFWHTNDLYFNRSGRVNLYGPKYAASVWQLPILADLGFTTDDGAPARAFELFAGRLTADGFCDLTGKGYPLLRANAIACYAFLRMGWGPSDLGAPLAWLAAQQRADGGWADVHEIREPDAPSTVATTSHVTTALGYADRVDDVIAFKVERETANNYLSNNLLSDYAGRFQPTRKPWRRLSWPQYDYDILTVTEALWVAGAPDEYERKAAELLIELQTPKGFWRQRVRFVVPSVVSMVEPGHSSRWITMRAAKVIIAIIRRTESKK